MSQIIQELSEQGGCVAPLCGAVGLPRAQFYRHRKALEQKALEQKALEQKALEQKALELAKTKGTSTDTVLRQQVQQVALEWSCYGYHRVTHELHRQGIQANSKRVLRLMREENLCKL